MSHPAIIIDGIGKSYRIGLKEESYPTFREALTRMVSAPLRRLRSLGERGTEQDTFWALRNVSFEVKRGEAIGVIGRNGAGKSTLLKILSRITEPTEGCVRLRGRVASLLEVGTGFHPELTGRENIYLSGSIQGMRKAEIDAKFDEIVAFAEIEKFLDTPVKRFSSGMYVRLAFAVAAHLDPEILIVDEVLAVGDAEFQKKCLGKMRQVAEGSGRTVLFVSHSMSAISQLCQKAVLLERGTLKRHGAVDEVVRDYMSVCSEQAASGDLVNHPNRVSSVRGVFRRIEVLDEFRRPSASFKPLDTVVIRLHVRAATPIGSPRVGVGICNDAGDRVCCVASYLGNTALPILEGDRAVEVRFEMPPLIPGDYILDLSIQTGDHRTIDHIPAAVPVAVVDDDGYLGVTLQKREWWTGYMMVRSEWRVA